MVLERIFTVLDQDLSDNTYLVIGTMDQVDRERIDQEKLPIRDSIEPLYDAREEVVLKPHGRIEKKQRSL